MRILGVLPGADPTGGAEQSFATTARLLADDGVELHLAVLTERQDLAPRLRADGVVIHDLSGARGRLGQTVAIGRLIRRIRPDVVHATLWDAVFPTQLAAIVTRSPVLVTWAAVGNASAHLGDAGWKHVVIHWTDRVLAVVTDTHFHAVTDGVATANARSLGVRTDRVHVVHRGRADVETPSRRAIDGLRSELDLPQGSPVVLAVGRQEPIKDHPTLVRAISIVRSTTPEVRLVVAGRTGADSSRLRTVIDDTDTADAIRLTGHRDDVVDLLGLADVFVSSSRSEGAAGGVIEAMRSGVPVVSTDVEGLRGVLRDEVDALVVPVGDPAALAAAVSRLIDDPELASRIGTAGRTTYESRFRVEVAAAAMADLYRTVAGSGRAGSAT